MGTAFKQRYNRTTLKQGTDILISDGIERYFSPTPLEQKDRFRHLVQNLREGTFLFMNNFPCDTVKEDCRKKGKILETISIPDLCKRNEELFKYLQKKEAFQDQWEIHQGQQAVTIYSGEFAKKAFLTTNLHEVIRGNKLSMQQVFGLLSAIQVHASDLQKATGPARGLHEFQYE